MDDNEANQAFLGSFAFKTAQGQTGARNPVCGMVLDCSSVPTKNINILIFRSEDGFWQIALVLAYSIRNACIGSIRDALHAGTRQARVATTNMDAATDAKIAGSSGRVP